MRITLDASRIRFEALEKDDVDKIYNDSFVQDQYRNDLVKYEYCERSDAGYIGVYVDTELAGMFYCVDMSPIEVEVHLAFYKEFTPYSRILCKEFIKWMFEENGIHRITTYVMDYRRIGVNLALKLGFQYEGFMRKCSIRDGVWYGKHVLGIVKG